MLLRTDRRTQYGNAVRCVAARQKSAPSGFLHIETQKGKGYSYAEENPGEYHGTSGFDIDTGKSFSSASTNFSNEFGLYLTELAKRDERICAITAAMKYGTGLNHFSRAFGQQGRFFDVGIAEPHAVTFAGGLAANGMLPVFAVYSSFLQRCYDQIIHDLSIEQQHVVIGIDRAGIVGSDGETHQGLFDVAMLSSVPGITRCTLRLPMRRCAARCTKACMSTPAYAVCAIRAEERASCPPSTRRCRGQSNQREQSLGCCWSPTAS